MICYQLKNGNLVIPRRAEGDGLIGDGMVVIDASHADYERWLPFAVVAPPEVEAAFGGEPDGS